MLGELLTYGAWGFITAAIVSSLIYVWRIIKTEGLFSPLASLPTFILATVVSTVFFGLVMAFEQRIGRPLFPFLTMWTLPQVFGVSLGVGLGLSFTRWFCLRERKLVTK